MRESTCTVSSSAFGCSPDGVVRTIWARTAMQAGSYGLPTRRAEGTLYGEAHLPAGELFEIIPIPGNADLLVEIKVIATGIGTIVHWNLVVPLRWAACTHQSASQSWKALKPKCTSAKIMHLACALCCLSSITLCSRTLFRCENLSS
jgi:hypothetical protein